MAREESPSPQSVDSNLCLPLRAVKQHDIFNIRSQAGVNPFFNKVEKHNHSTPCWWLLAAEHSVAQISILDFPDSNFKRTNHSDIF